MQRSHLELIYTEPAYREHIRRSNPYDDALRSWEVKTASDPPYVILDDPAGEPHPDDENEELRAWFETHFPARSTRPFLRDPRRFAHDRELALLRAGKRTSCHVTINRVDAALAASRSSAALYGPVPL